MNTERRPSLDVIERWLENDDRCIRIAAMKACSNREVPINLIEQGLRDSDWCVRLEAMKACSDREVPLNLIKKGLEDDNWRVRVAAMNACIGREVPIDLIKKGLKDLDGDVRVAAMNACSGREVPVDLIEMGLKDGDSSVRTAALNVCRANSILIPVIRTIEPPELVYKKCLGDVIVVASIPKDAQIRGEFGRMYRANRAIIKQIIGDTCGEPVGISSYDPKTLYYAGDEIEIEDFDLSYEECSTGFHFFCTIEEAKDY